MQINATDALKTHQDADCLITGEQLAQALDGMAASITRRLGDSAPLVLTVMNGGLIPAAQLLLRLQFPLQMDYLHATRYGNATTGGELQWRVYPSTPMEDRSVLIVDDIFDQGHTLAAISDYLHAKGAREVLTAVVINKLHDRKVDFQPDFIGLDVADRFLYGFGMDYQGFFRNANGIYAVKGL